MPTARSGGGSAVIDGKIYVAGGRPPRGSDLAVYDPSADAWTRCRTSRPSATTWASARSTGSSTWPAAGSAAASAAR